jgi:NAD(P)H-dependent flavin oxidoreductase YrpB (nitropropane dioxygenase family)
MIMMNNDICKMVGCEFPLFAFSHCRDVVVAVSLAGGCGVLGGSSFTPESLEMELAWIDEHVDGKPYGIDILIPENLGDIAQDITSEQLHAMVPEQHRKFTIELLAKYGVDLTPEEINAYDLPAIVGDVGERLMDVAFRHPIKMIANALGIAPQSMIDRARANHVPVGALVGAREHAIRQIDAGVDFLVAQGGEAAGHCGEVSTLVLVPEVIAAIKGIRPVPVLAAGGIMNGRQMAGCMAMGAQGAWTGTIWLATPESETSEVLRQKMLAATSRDTIRSKSRTGKPSRQLRSAWHDAWHGEDSPGTLPMPIMSVLAQPAFAKIDTSAELGNAQAMDLVSYWVGQGVGMVDSVRSSGNIVQQFKEEFGEAITGLNALLDE